MPTSSIGCSVKVLKPWIWNRVGSITPKIRLYFVCWSVFFFCWRKLFTNQDTSWNTLMKAIILVFHEKRFPPYLGHFSIFLLFWMYIFSLKRSKILWMIDLLFFSYFLSFTLFFCMPVKVFENSVTVNMNRKRRIRRVVIPLNAQWNHLPVIPSD